VVGVVGVRVVEDVPFECGDAAGVAYFADGVFLCRGEGGSFVAGHDGGGVDVVFWLRGRVTLPGVAEAFEHAGGDGFVGVVDECFHDDRVPSDSGVAGWGDGSPTFGGESRPTG
jgi:hypothetical protein